MRGINPQEINPDIPRVWKCDACKEEYTIPRRWVKSRNLGWQIIINWPMLERFIEKHMAAHGLDLSDEIEKWLDAGA